MNERIAKFIYARKLSGDNDMEFDYQFNYDMLSAPPLLSMIPEDIIYDIKDIAYSFKKTPTQKIKACDEILENYGFKRFHNGKNRIVYTNDSYPDIVVKVALDTVAITDSAAEFKNQFLFMPFVTKVFEVDPTGIIGVFERVRPFETKSEFAEFYDVIFDIITHVFVGEFVMWDIGARTFRNWGFRQGFGPVLLDFPYVYKVDRDKLICKEDDCGGLIDYDYGFNKLICTKCGKEITAKQLELVDNVDYSKRRFIKKSREIYGGSIDMIIDGFKMNIVDGNGKIIVEHNKETKYINRNFTSNDMTDKRNINDIDPRTIVRSGGDDNFKISIVSVPKKEVKNVTNPRRVYKKSIGMNKKKSETTGFKASLVTPDGNVVSTTKAQVSLKDIAFGEDNNKFINNLENAVVEQIIKDEESKKDNEYKDEEISETYMKDLGISEERKEELNKDAKEIVEDILSDTNIEEKEADTSNISEEIKEEIEERAKEIVEDILSNIEENEEVKDDNVLLSDIKQVVDEIFDTTDISEFNLNEASDDEVLNIMDIEDLLEDNEEVIEDNTDITEEITEDNTDEVLDDIYENKEIIEESNDISSSIADDKEQETDSYDEDLVSDIFAGDNNINVEHDANADMFDTPQYTQLVEPNVNPFTINNNNFKENDDMKNLKKDYEVFTNRDEEIEDDFYNEFEEDDSEVNFEKIKKRQRSER